MDLTWWKEGDSSEDRAYLYKLEKLRIVRCETTDSSTSRYRWGLTKKGEEIVRIHNLLDLWGQGEIKDFYAQLMFLKTLGKW